MREHRAGKAAAAFALEPPAARTPLLRAQVGSQHRDLDVANRAEVAVAYQLFDRRDLRDEAKLVRDAAGGPGPPQGLTHLHGLRDVARERLLAEHVLPGAQRGDRVVVVRERRRRDGYGVELAAREHRFARFERGTARSPRERPLQRSTATRSRRPRSADGSGVPGGERRRRIPRRRCRCVLASRPFVMPFAAPRPPRRRRRPRAARSRSSTAGRCRPRRPRCPSVER